MSSVRIKAACSLCTCVFQGPARWFCSKPAAGTRQTDWACQAEVDVLEWEFCLFVRPCCLVWCSQVAEFIDERPDEVKLMEEFPNKLQMEAVRR